MNRKKYTNRNGGYSVCGDIIVRGHNAQIAQKYEGLASEAARGGDIRSYHIFLNHAEHWRKVEER